MAGNTPVYGFPYPEPTDLVADYPALGQQLAEDIEDVLPTIGGLAPATPTSIANSGGSASLSGNTVTFSGVSSVSLNGCFTGDYDNYMLKYDLTSSTSTFVSMRLTASGTAAATNYNRQYISATSTTVTGLAQNAQGEWQIDGNTFNGRQAVDIHLFKPFAAAATGARFEVQQPAMRATFQIGEHTTTSAYDGFLITTNAGTITGTVSVYGYKK